MKRPDKSTKNVIDPEIILQAFDLASHQDSIFAKQIQSFSIGNGYRATDTVAAAIRYGIMIAEKRDEARMTAEVQKAREKAEAAEQRMQDYIGAGDRNVIPAARIRGALSWITDPEILRELAADFINRACQLEAGTAAIRPLFAAFDPGIDAPREPGTDELTENNPEE